jgi:hypothetical protein
MEGISPSQGLCLHKVIMKRLQPTDIHISNGIGTMIVEYQRAKRFDALDSAAALICHCVILDSESVIIILLSAIDP